MFQSTTSTRLLCMIDMSPSRSNLCHRKQKINKIKQHNINRIYSYRINHNHKLLQTGIYAMLLTVMEFMKGNENHANQL